MGNDPLFPEVLAPENVMLLPTALVDMSFRPVMVAVCTPSKDATEALDPENVPPPSAGP